MAARAEGVRELVRLLSTLLRRSETSHAQRGLRGCEEAHGRLRAGRCVERRRTSKISLKVQYLILKATHSVVIRAIAVEGSPCSLR